MPTLQQYRLWNVILPRSLHEHAKDNKIREAVKDRHDKAMRAATSASTELSDADRELKTAKTNLKNANTEYETEKRAEQVAKAILKALQKLCPGK